MKKSSVLIRSAALFTATVMAVTVAVSLCAGILGTWIQLSQTTKRTLRPRADYLAQKASGDYNQAGEVIGQIEDEARLMASGGEYVWLVQYMLGATPVGSEQPFPWGDPNANANRDMTRPAWVRMNGRLYAYMEAPVKLERGYTPYIGVAVPVRGMAMGVIFTAVNGTWV